MLWAALLVMAAGRAFAQPFPGPAVPAGEGLRRGNWVVAPTLLLDETYTDNVFLSPDAVKVGDWVTRIVPAIALDYAGPRLKFNVVYAPEILAYAETEREDNVFHRGKALASLELAENLLFLDGGATVNQYDVSLQKPLTISNTNITGNRSTVATSYLSPYVQRDIGTSMRALARFTYSTWRSDDPFLTVPDNDAGRVELRLASGPSYRSFSWKADYSNELIRYETLQESRSEMLTANARMELGSTWALLAQAGYESYDAGFAVPPVEGPRYGGGLEWTPTERTRVAAGVGKRLGNLTYAFDFRHRTRLTIWSASYNEEVTTTRSEFFVPATPSTADALDKLFLSQYPDPAERQKAVQDFIAEKGLPSSLSAPVNFFTDQLYLRKRWGASAGLLGVRNSVLANAFWELRKALNTGADQPLVGDFASSQQIEMMGGGVAWSLRLTTRNTWNFNAGYTRNGFLDTPRVDNFSYLRAGLTRQLQPRVSASVLYRRQQLRSTTATANYVENAGIASLRVSF